MNENRKRKNLEWFDFIQLVNGRLQNSGIKEEFRVQISLFARNFLEANNIKWSGFGWDELSYNGISGKTFPVSLLRAFVNLVLQSATIEEIYKNAAASLWEEISMATKNYHGYNENVERAINTRTYY